MCSRFRSRLWPALCVLMALASAASAAGELRVCADPDQPPYSRRDGSGFENRIAAVLARTLDATPVFVWLPQGRGYIRKTLNAHRCDVVMGVPAHFDPVRTTRPYYRSSYAAVTAAGGFAFSGFDDPKLRGVLVGVQLVGDDLAATPPGHALVQRGLVVNVRGYTVYGEGPQGERMVGDVASGRIAVALLWGPQAAYFASRAAAPLELSVLRRPEDVAVPFEYSIALGVRKGDAALQQALDRALAQAQPEIDAILAEFGVPRTDAPAVRGASR